MTENLEFHYRFEGQIGVGAQGQIHRVLKKSTGERFAFKLLNKGNELKHTLREISILKNIYHPNVVKYIDSDLNPPHLVMELCPNGTLRSMIDNRFEDKFSKNEIFKYIY